tara:strand:- start:75 stop:434 length:360 start_codon:yes stop_codon:yes gene_type:complete
MRIEDLKPRKKSLLSMLGSGVKTVKHKAKSLLNWKPKSNPFNDPYYFDKVNKQIEKNVQRRFDTLSNFKAEIKGGGHYSRSEGWKDPKIGKKLKSLLKYKNIKTGLRSDRRKIKKYTTK